MLADRSFAKKGSLEGSFMKANDGIVVVEHLLSQHASFQQDPQVSNTDYNSELDSSELRIENLED